VLRTRWEAYRYLGDDAKTDAAREDLEKFGRLTEDAKRIYNEGVALSDAGDDAGAFARFQEALEADPNLQEALLAVAATGLKIDRAAEALAAAETLLEADAENAEALKARYNAALMLKDEAKVVEALQGLATIDATTARDNLYQLASAAYDRDDIVTARERFDKVLELDPKHPRSHYFIGLIFMRDLGKESQEQAKTYLERFVELAPDDPEAATASEILRYMKGS
jgi:tetratricopeptide (TPR) repeat protein